MGVDCLEALRVYQIRYEDVLEFSQLAIVFATQLHDDGLVHELRLRHALLSACCSFVRFVIIFCYFMLELKIKFIATFAGENCVPANYKR